MSDTSLNKIIQYGTAADRVAFTPDPASGSQVLYIWFETDNPPDTYVWDGSAWVQINPPGAGGDVVGPASAVNNHLAVFDGTTGKLIKDGGAAPAAGITQLTGNVTAGPGSGSQAATINVANRTRQIGITIDGGGSPITTGQKGYKSFPVAGVITGVRLLADQSGSAVVDIWKDTFANYPPTVLDTITASALPTLSTQNHSEDNTLTGWTTSVAAGDVFGFNVNSASTITRLTLELTIVVS